MPDQQLAARCIHLLSQRDLRKLVSLELRTRIAWAYLQSALDDPGRFKLMFSGALEVEFDHPQFVETSQKNISLLEEIIVFFQNKGQLAAGQAELLAIKLWSSVHGFTNLMLENQFPPEYLQGQDLIDLLQATIS